MMKKTILILSAIVFAAISGAQTNSSDEKQAINTLKTFYVEYMSEFSNSVDIKQFENKLERLRKEYCTAKCRRQYKKLVGETDGDPIINGQDSGAEFAKTLSIRRIEKSTNKYIVSYYYFIDDGGGKQHKETITIKLLLIKEKRNFKIDAFL